MRCENIPGLSFLADEGTLGRLAAWRLRRHLATCPTCAAERAELSKLDTDLLVNDPAGSLALPREYRPARSASPALPRGVLLLGISTVVLGAMGAGVIFAPSRRAFAEVQQAVESVRTVEWSQTEFNTSGRRESLNIRARLNPPVMRLEPAGLVVNDYQGPRVSLKTLEGFYTYRPQIREIQFSPYDGPGGSYAAGLRTEILGKLLFTPSNTIKLLWQMRTVSLNGKPAVLFTYQSVPEIKDLLHEINRYTLSVWTDPETRRVLRRELENRNIVTDVVTYRMVVEGIRYDVPVSDSLNAPVGTPIYHDNYLWERGSSITLTAKETTEVKRLMDETYAGILASDWKRASASWDLNYAPSLPNSPVPPGGTEKWLRRKVAQGHTYSTMRRIVISGVNEAPYTRVLGYGDALVPPGQPRLIAVSITPGIRTRDGLQEVGAETFYYRKDTKGSLRIVGWQYPEGARKKRRQDWLEKRKAGNEK